MADSCSSNQEIIRGEGLFLHEGLRTKAAALDFISERAVALGFADNRATLRADLAERESEMTTGLMAGFAIPHAKSDSVQHAGILFIRNDHELAWKTLDDSKVRYLFALLVPKDGCRAHLEVLSKLATRLLEQDFRDRIIFEDDASALLTFIRHSIA